MSQEKKKPVGYILEPRIVSAEDEWPGDEKHKGKFCFHAQCVVHPFDKAFTKRNSLMRSSTLVRVDIENGVFETENTTYIVIPRSQEEAYRMTDPLPERSEDWARDPAYQWPHPLAPRSSGPQS